MSLEYEIHLESQKVSHSVKEVLRIFQGCLKEDKSVFLERFKQVQWVFHGGSKSVSWKSLGCFMDISRLFQGYLKEIQTV